MEEKIVLKMEEYEAADQEIHDLLRALQRYNEKYINAANALIDDITEYKEKYHSFLYR